MCAREMCIVNSISLQVRRGGFLFSQAKTILDALGLLSWLWRLMRDGQADKLPKAYNENLSETLYTAYLQKVVDFPAEDIIFDPNIFPVATGMEEHRNNYACRFLL